MDCRSGVAFFANTVVNETLDQNSL
jgi:hypothetical protein